MKINRMAVVCAALCIPVLAGCGTTVQRMDVNEVKDISGRWNDTDSRLTAEEMISECLGGGWLANAQAAKPGTPTVIVGTVRNTSSEHINTSTFVEDLQRALINSGKVSFVASKNERGEVRDERKDQDVNSSDDTRKAQGQEIGADFMLNGEITTIDDTEGGKRVILYQTNLKLVNIKTNQIVWNGQKKLKKYVKRSSASF